jgi:hypothetical protein
MGFELRLIFFAKIQQVFLDFNNEPAVLLIKLYELRKYCELLLELQDSVSQHNITQPPEILWT